MSALPSALTTTLPGSRWWTPPRSMTSTPLMNTNVSSSQKNCSWNGPENAKRSRASTENQESWNQPCAFVMFSPLMFMPNQAAGSEVMRGPNDGGKTYWVATHPCPAPKLAELYQYGQMLQSSGSAQ